MTPTLYELHKDAFDRLANDGKKSIAEMAKHFTTCGDMDKALGMNNCVHHWARHGGNASNNSEALARYWLAQNITTANAKDASTATPEPATQNPDSVMAIIACDRATFSKLQKLAPIMGFEVIDV